MKLLVVSDIHANWPALRAIEEDADSVICLGDLVSYGPFPRECITWVRERACHVVRGNHDSALAFGIDPRVGAQSRPLAEATLARHRQLLSAEDLAWLRGLPTEARFNFGATRYVAIHASPSNHLFNWRLTPDLADEEFMRETQGVDADHLLLGHTHLPMRRRAGGITVLNPGSVGQPLDRDPRASFAVIEDGIPTIRRVEYDQDATIWGIRDLGLDPETGEALIAILRTGTPPAPGTANAGSVRKSEADRR